MKASATILIAVVGILATTSSLLAQPIVPDPNIRRIRVLPRPAASPEPAASPAPAEGESFEAVLEKCPKLKEHLVWVTGDGKRVPLDEWTSEQKLRIQMFYQRMIAGTADLGMRLPTEKNFLAPGHPPYFTVDQAFDVYAAHAAHVLYVEAKRLVPWSIESRPAVELEKLLTSSSYFARIGPTIGEVYPEGIKAGRDFADVPENDGLGELNGDPRVGYEYLSGKTSKSHKSLIGKTELETLVNLTAWMRDNVGHGSLDNKWIERAKASRWLEDRLRPLQSGKVIVLVMGCHSASKLMVDMARSVNIPLLHVRCPDEEKADQSVHDISATHGGLVYGWGGTKPPLVLWHADDIYAQNADECWPLDPKTGGLAGAAEADQQFFDAHWVTPGELKEIGFEYRLQRGTPIKGARQNEDRLDYGWFCGQWNIKGKSHLSQYYQLKFDYDLCSDTLLQRYVRSGEKGVRGWLTDAIKENRGDFTDDELPPLHSVQEYQARAEACVNALGGKEKVQKLLDDYKQVRNDESIRGPLREKLLEAMASTPGASAVGSPTPSPGPSPHPVHGTDASHAKAQPTASPAEAGPLRLQIASSTDDANEITCQATNPGNSAVAIKPFGTAGNIIHVVLPEGREMSLALPSDKITQIEPGKTLTWKLDLARWKPLSNPGAYKFTWKVGEQTSDALEVTRQ